MAAAALPLPGGAGVVGGSGAGATGLGAAAGAVARAAGVDGGCGRNGGCGGSGGRRGSFGLTGLFGSHQAGELALHLGLHGSLLVDGLGRGVAGGGDLLGVGGRFGASCVELLDLALGALLGCLQLIDQVLARPRGDLDVGPGLGSLVGLTLEEGVDLAATGRLIGLDRVGPHLGPALLELGAGLVGVALHLGHLGLGLAQLVVGPLELGGQVHLLGLEGGEPLGDGGRPRAQIVRGLGSGGRRPDGREEQTDGHEGGGQQGRARSGGRTHVAVSLQNRDDE